MIDGKSRNNLELYRATLMENGLSADAIAQDQFFGHDYFQLVDPDGNGITSIPATQESYKYKVRGLSSGGRESRVWPLGVGEMADVFVDPVFGNHIDQIVALAQRDKILTIYPWREFTAAGGLMNYGASIPDAYRQVGVYIGQILKGANPAELPVQRPTKLGSSLST